MGSNVLSVEHEIFYGYVFEPDDLDNQPDTSAAADAILAERGIPDPYDTAPEGDAYRTWADEHEAETDAYLAQWIDAESALPVATGTHGNDVVPTVYLYLRGTNRATPKSVERAVPHLAPIPVTGRPSHPEWRVTLDEFLTSQGVTPPTGENQPGWWSAAYEDRD
jgi:hypothetical protein